MRPHLHLRVEGGGRLAGFRVDVVKPTYKALDDTQVAKFSGHLTVSHKVESEVV